MEPAVPDEAPPVDIHAPFTRAERMEQLAEIDQDIASLLQLSGKAIQSLGHQTPANNGASGAEGAPERPPQALTTEEQTQAFTENMDKFLSTLHAVDVRLKRQIFGLEEAGILTLDETKPSHKEAGGGAQRPTLEPNGLGMVGNLDVGWLNSRSNQVEREMEAELWVKARTHLENVAGGASSASGNDDVHMTG